MNRFLQQTLAVPRWRTTIICILGGITLTYATAWLLLIVGPLSKERAHTPPARPPRIEMFGDMNLHATGWRSVGIRFEFWFDQTAANTLVRYGAGWPTLSVESRFAQLDGVDVPVGALSRGIATGYQRRDRTRILLPLRPIFPGFAINVIFYAVGILLLTRASLSLRRLRRRRRHRCEGCNYHLKDLTACPECGHITHHDPKGVNANSRG